MEIPFSSESREKGLVVGPPLVIEGANGIRKEDL